MQEKGFSPKPEETEAVLPPSDFGGEFMAAWLHRRKKNPENTEDDDEETEKPKSRFSRLFKKLFPRIAAKGTVDPIERANNPLHELFIPLASKEVAGERDQEQETKASDLESPGLIISKDSQTTEQLYSPVVEKNEVVAQLRNPNEHIAREIEEPSTLSIRNVEASNIRAAETPRFERRTETPSIKREQVIEKRVAEPLAVLEYFLRRRAVKNVERQVKKESASIEKKLRQSNESNERLRDLSNKSQEQLQELRAKRQVEKPVIEKVETIRTEPIIERPDPAKVERTVSREVQKEESKPRIEESEYRIKEVPVQPERVLEQVLQAAEKNTPIEKSYERRHETKDEPSKFDAGLSSGAVPIGSVIAQSYHQNLSNNQQTSSENRAKTVTRQAGMYRQAAVNGFWTALVLIVAIITIALMQN